MLSFRFTIIIIFYRANRCLAVRNLKGLQDCIGLTVVHPTWQRTKPDDPEDTHCGWVFAESTTVLKSPAGHGSFAIPGSELDPINNFKNVREIYEASHDQFKKYSVPILFDKETNRIVNNESSEIIRMLSYVFDEYATGTFKSTSFYPESLRTEIDEVNSWIYPSINDGVYKCGFAKTQAAYEEAFDELFNALNKLENIL